jgi:folate-dependent phosphoribosylglycinamide formyltransferase PurN
MKKWIALFSQTGSEVCEISKQLQRWPDLIVTNNQELDSINHEVLKHSKVLFVSEKPVDAEYHQMLSGGDIITMHGWLRIIPEKICQQYTIYNGHPGLITKYPDLKGKDPQKKAVDLQLETSGCVIHRAVAEVDAGEIFMDHEVDIKDLNEEEVINKLHGLSIELWVKFLSGMKL